LAPTIREEIEFSLSETGTGLAPGNDRTVTEGLVTLPKTEKVSDTEVYLLDGMNNRIKRICGFDKGGGGPCLNIAGLGTVHKDFGYCKAHERGAADKMWMLFANEQHLPRNLGDYIKTAQSLEQGDLASLDNDIRLLYALLANVLHREEGDDRPLNAKELDSARRTINSIAELKRIRHTIEKEVKLDITTVKEFVKEIFKVLEHHVQGHQLRMIFNSIMQDIILPLSARNRVADANAVDVDFSEITDKFKDGSNGTKNS